MRHALLRSGAAVGVLALCAAAWVLAIPTYGSYRPARITPEWYVQHFPGCMDVCGSRAQEWREAVRWHSVRRRPDVVTALIRVINDSTVSVYTRGRAVYMLGTTRQPRAREFLVELLERRRAWDSARQNVIRALAGSGPPLPEAGYRVLAEVLHPEDPDASTDAERESALRALVHLRTERARQILVLQLDRETDPHLRDSIQRALRAWSTRR